MSYYPRNHPSYVISMDTEHRGDGKNLFDVAFVCFKNGEIIQQFQFIRKDIVQYYINITNSLDGGFWSYPKNLNQLLHLKQLCDLEIKEENINLVVSLTEKDYAWQIRRAIDYLHQQYPQAIWVSDTPGMDLSAINFVLMSNNNRPMHFNKTGEYRGFKFETDKQIGSNPDRTHSSVNDAIWIGSTWIKKQTFLSRPPGL